MVSHDEIVAAMRACEPYTASDLADELGEPRRTIDYNLRQLHEAGRVQRKQHSKRRVSWWVENED